MAEQEKPRDYKIFDGFVKSNLLFKALYIFTLPSIVVPVLIEGLEYRAAQNRVEQYEDARLNAIQNRVQAPTTESAIERDLNANLADVGTKFQNMVSKTENAAAKMR